MSREWYPTPLEMKCLAHLDSLGGWKILGREKPDDTQILPWSPFQRIFVINFVQFALILAVVFFLLENGAGGAWADIREDMPYGLGGAVVIAFVMGVYVTHLYRRTWNRRARSLVWDEA